MLESCNTSGSRRAHAATHRQAAANRALISCLLAVKAHASAVRTSRSRDNRPIIDQERPENRPCHAARRCLRLTTPPSGRRARRASRFSPRKVQEILVIVRTWLYQAARDPVVAEEASLSRPLSPAQAPRKGREWILAARRPEESDRVAGGIPASQYAGAEQPMSAGVTAVSRAHPVVRGPRASAA